MATFSHPSKLPLIISKGRFKHLSNLDESELESFLSYLIRFTCKEFGLEMNHIPSWWTENLLYHPDFARGLIPAPESRNKHVKLRRLVKLCYLYYDCKSLLIMSEQLASLHHRSYKFMLEPSGNVAVHRVETMTVLVRVPSSNLSYDVDGKPNMENGRVKPNAAITRRPTFTSILSPSKKAMIEPTEEVIILDSSSESDDEVQIVSYEPGAFPSTPPKTRPGPACSKIRHISRPFIGLTSVQQRLALAASPRPDSPVRPAPQPQDCRPYRHPRPPSQGWLPYSQLPCPQGYQPYRQLPCRKGYQPYRQLPCPQGYQPYIQPPPQPQVPARSKYLLCRPKRNIRFEEVDLTADDDDDEDVFQPTSPKDLSQSDFLARMGLGSSSVPEATPMKNLPPPPVILKNKRLNVRDIPCTMVPHLVSIGYLPRRALCSTAEVSKRIEFIDRYTSKDTNWFLVTVNTRDRAAVAAVVKKCWIPVKRLNSADLRRWRR